MFIFNGKRKKDYKRALELVNRSLSLAKDSTELYPLWNNKGEILLEMNQYDSAHFYLSKDTRDYDPYFKATHYLNWSIYEEKIKIFPKRWNTASGMPNCWIPSIKKAGV